MGLKPRQASAASLRKKISAAFSGWDLSAAAEASRELLARDATDRHALSMLACALAFDGGQRGPVARELMDAHAHVGTDSGLLWNLQFYYIDCYNLRAQDPSRLRLSEKAVDEFFAAGGKLPKQFGAWGNTCNTYLAAGRFDDAIALAERGLKIHKSPSAYNAIAAARSYQRNRGAVLKTLTTASRQKGFDDYAAIYAEDAHRWLRDDPDFNALFPQWRGLFAGFGSVSPPEELIQLYAFTVENPSEFCQEFTFVEGETYIESNWSSEPEFVERVRVFASPSADGTDYALWVQPGVPASEMPIVALGGEGGLQVVANDARDFLKLLSYDAAPSVSWTGVRFDRNEEYWEASSNHSTFVRWLRDRFELTACENPAAIVESAQKRWQPTLEKWSKPLLRS